MSKRRRLRKGGGTPFVQIFHWMMQCPAWRDLGPVPQALYLVLKRYYTGTNNGSIGLSCRQAADAIDMHYSTVSRAFKKLHDHGFVVEVTKGVVGRGSGYNKATEWLLDECRDDRNGKPPTKRFLQWSKSKNTVAKAEEGVASLKREGNPIPQNAPSRFASATQEGSSARTTLQPRNTLTSSHTHCAADEARGEAVPPKRSKPRDACAPLGSPVVASVPIEKKSPTSSVSAGSAINLPGDEAQPVQIGDVANAILERARAG
jgi:hypothetical protein